MLAERMGKDVWIFGYGSLVWRPDFVFSERRPGWIEGYERRFWQASTDHRGVPEAPGRVVTLIASEGARCWGAAYRVAESQSAEVFEALDHRERAGFERSEVTVHAAIGPLRAQMYIAPTSNPSYVGPAPLDEIARQIRSAHGPSGANAEYLIRLAEALREMGGEDPHIEALMAQYEALDGDPE